jgi:DNA-binding MarR family transcriptional regulator
MPLSTTQARVLIALAAYTFGKRSPVFYFALSIKMSETHVRRILDQLKDLGLVEAIPSPVKFNKASSIWVLTELGQQTVKELALADR